MAYIAGNAWFCCDRCGQKWRRNFLCVEWDNLVVCPPCLDPLPPEMLPPDVYPEGLPLPYARPPQDGDDFLQDQTLLIAVPPPNDNYQGVLSPQYLQESPVEPLPADEVASSQFFRTGPVRS